MAEACEAAVKVQTKSDTRWISRWAKDDRKLMFLVLRRIERDWKMSPKTWTARMMSLRRWLAMAALAALCVGCAPDRQAGYNAFLSECLGATPAMRGNYEKRAGCWRAAANTYFPDDPRLALIEAGRVRLAQRVDRGEITAEDADVQLSRVLLDATRHVEVAEELRRMDRPILLGRW